MLTSDDVQHGKRVEPCGDRPSRRGFVGRFVQLQFGLTLYGVATAVRVRANLGLDPWGAFHQGISRVTRLSFGATIILIGAIVLLLWVPLRQKPGIGTISNIIVIGLATDVTLAILPMRTASLLSCSPLLSGRC